MQTEPADNPSLDPGTPGERTTLAGMWPWLPGVCALVGLAGLGVALGLGLARADHLRRFLHAYLVSYCYFLSISLGALFFVALQHAVRAGWSVSVRRLAELVAANMPCLAVLFLPILLSVLVYPLAELVAAYMPGLATRIQPVLDSVLESRGSLYTWAAPAGSEGAELPACKATYYLNPPLFTLRAGVYFVIWLWLARFYLQRSLQQDTTADPALTLRMERLSPLALVLLGFTASFAAVDWLMSLDPMWFSTIFGVYYFSGAAVGVLAAVILMGLLLQAGGRVTESLTVEHYHDLGKLLLGFVVFWGYIAFSQYMLIWYANIPEETVWYLARQTGAWKWVSLVLLFGHLLIPFFGLLSRQSKRRKAILGFWAVWLLVAHWIDLYWLVMPGLEPGGGAAVSVWPGAIELGTLLGLGGIYLAGLLWTMGRRPLVALGDPRLAESLAFENM